METNHQRSLSTDEEAKEGEKHEKNMNGCNPKIP